MKFQKGTIKGFVVGAVAATMVAGSAVPAAASSMKTINVAMGGIKVYVDGELKQLWDAKGNKIEPLIYDGTTYLPLRAVVGLLSDKNVSWNRNTESVYIGKVPNVEKVPISELSVLEKNSYTQLIPSDKPYEIEVFKEPMMISNGFYSGNGRVRYKVDSAYNKLNGTLIVPDKAKYMDTNYLEIYSVDRYGEKTLLDRYDIRHGDYPMEISTNISGCSFIEIQLTACAFYDVTLTPAD